MVSDLEAVVDAAAPGRPLGLMAAEHMAIPALVYAARHPERVGALVLWLGVSRGEDMFGGRMNTMHRPGAQRLGVLARSRSRTRSGLRAHPRVGRSSSLRTKPRPRSHTSRSWRRCVAGTRLPLLAEIKVPALVLGRRDFRPIPIETIRGLAAALPNAELVTLEGAATAMTTADVGAAIRAFFARLFAAQARPPRAPEPVASGTAVILFTDIVDSTALTERMGDARFRDASRELDECCARRSATQAERPVEGKLLGDGVMGRFRLRRRLSMGPAVPGAERASELGLHIGLHAGDVIREDGNVFGGAVNIASRICGLSAPGRSWCRTWCAGWRDRRRAWSSRIAASRR